MSAGGAVDNVAVLSEAMAILCGMDTGLDTSALARIAGEQYGLFTRAQARSAAERLTLLLLRRAGIAGWTANQEIYDEHGLIGVGDVVFGDRRLVVEIDGQAHHTDPASFQRDRERQNRLVAAGWTVLRFTWRDLTRRPVYVVATIEAMLAR